MSTNGLLSLIKKVSKDSQLNEEGIRQSLANLRFMLLEEPMLINHRIKNMFNSTFLMVAIAFRQEDIIKMIINENPNLDVCNNVIDIFFLYLLFIFALLHG